MSIFSYFNRIFNSGYSNLDNDAKNEEETKMLKNHFRENLSRSDSNQTKNQDVVSILIQGFNSFN